MKIDIDKQEYFDEYMETLEETSVCPYCLEDRPPHSACCDEMHVCTAYRDKRGEVILEADLETEFLKWVDKNYFELAQRAHEKSLEGDDSAYDSYKDSLLDKDDDNGKG